MGSVDSLCQCGKCSENKVLRIVLLRCCAVRAVLSEAAAGSIYLTYLIILELM
jgi:hypothetical protein